MFSQIKPSRQTSSIGSMASTASRMQLVADEAAHLPSLQHRKSIAFPNYLTAPRSYNPED
jgi:hypothetical protein